MTTMTRILVVEDDAGLREALIDTLELSGYQCTAAENAERAVIVLKQQNFDLIVSDVQMGTMSGLDLLRHVRLNYANLPMLMMTAYGTINDAVQAMREGAIDYLTKPFAPEVLLNTVSRYLPSNIIESAQPIVHDPKSKALLLLAERVAQSEANVMVLGPSGSGKEVLSRYLHDHSKRNDGPFVAINCAAIPESMLEATLFGYEKGAFTGAVQACSGKFEQAQGGTILLDEITEMDLSLQAKLLRVLQEKEVERLGGRKTIKLDVRIIATSNRDLKQAVADGKFREDLYYRLNVFPLTWHPLSERPLDIVPIAEHLIERHARSANTAIPRLTESAKQKLSRHFWPGNVRELDNVMQRAMILKLNDDIDTDAILIEEYAVDAIASASINNYRVEAEPKASELTDEIHVGNPDGGAGCFKDEIRDQEFKLILETIRACNGKRTAIAEKLGISPRTLRYKIARMREHGINIPA